MNQYFTIVDVPDFGWKINYRHKIMMLGSCFTENMGQKLEDYKFNIDQNPFGILYNPESIAKSLNRLIDATPYTEKDLFEHEGIWGSFDHHSRFSSVDKNETLDKINTRLHSASLHLKEADHLFISFGTSWIYELQKTSKIVSNCHKFPASDFKRSKLTIENITERYRVLLADLWKFNSNLKIIFTVSPIRHWKDGAVENQLSKSTLLIAVDELIKIVGIEKCAYFPSYEIVMDELRDYRFYASDLLHLNDSAVEHIWDKFMNIMFADETKKIMKDVIKLAKAMRHRPFNLESEPYRKFLLYNLELINGLTNNFPFLNLLNEKKHFERKLVDSQGRL